MFGAQALTDKITEDVKLVGATINCGGAYGVPPTPHVQSYLVATDLQGLAVLRSKARFCPPLPCVCLPFSPAILEVDKPYCAQCRPRCQTSACDTRAGHLRVSQAFQSPLLRQSVAVRALLLSVLNAAAGAGNRLPVLGVHRGDGRLL